MQQLGMDGGRFDVALVAQAEPQAFGLESIELLVAGHAGSTPRPLAKVASGGELSRLALAVAISTRQAAVPTLIFDEIDAGIGGSVADQVGRLMKQLGRSCQVLAVTHLAQVAACADRHFVVSKALHGGATLSAVEAVAGEARVSEVARMLGGEPAVRHQPRACVGDARHAAGSGPMSTPGARREVVLITGISGSGKSVALHALEDAGFFCVDNLPPELLRRLIRLEHERFTDRVAVAVDVRNAASLPGLIPLIRDLQGEDVHIRSLFLDASTDALLRRFSETRRPHPLSARAASGNGTRVLIDAIELERELLAELREVSTVIDTSQLRQRAAAQLGARAGQRAGDRADAGVRVLRLQARRAAGRRLRVRRAHVAEPALRGRTAAADRARRAGGRLPSSTA